MPPDDDLGELRYRVVQLETHLHDAEGKLDRLHDELAAERLAAERREKARLTYGISALGAATIVLGGLIWTNLHQIIGGK